MEFAALSHPFRQQILTLLHLKPATVGKLTDKIDASQPVISQHLKVLRETGLDDATPDGVKRIFSIQESRLRELRMFLQEHWQASLNSLDQETPKDA
ncbi:MAG: metalloregulator ArsR/SmtB family transcription factor [Sulfitobacter sp.]